MTKTTAPRPHHFDESGAERRNLTPQITEMSPRLVISTVVERSGEISLPHGTQNIGAGDLSALSHNRAEVPLFQYWPLPPLEMTIVAGSI